METKDRANSTFSVERGHSGTEERETPGIVRRRYHAGHPDTSGENDLPEGGTMPIHESDRKQR